MRRRNVVLIVALSIVVVTVLLLARRAPTAGTAPGVLQGGGDPAAPVPPGAASLGEFASAPLPAARGNLEIQGEVRGAAGPIAGALVTATTSLGGDVLSELRCHCGNDCGQRLLECGCPEAAAQLLELVLERRGEAPPVARATTDAEGRFVLTGLEDGSYAVWADAPALGTGLARAVRAGDERVTIDVSGGVPLDGTVVGEDGKALAGARVTAIFARHSRFFDAVSGADGTFRFGALPAGAYSVVASRDGLLPDRARVTEDARRRVRLELVAPGVLSGAVTLDGKAVPGAEVVAGGEHRKARTRTDDGGIFSFQGLHPGEYEVTATASGRVARRSVTIPRGHDVAGVALALGIGVVIEGTVVDGAHVPLAGAKVSIDEVVPSVRSSVATARTDTTGRFRLGPIERGEFDLSVKIDGYVSATDVRVTAVESRTIEVVLQRAARIEGIVVDPDGQPVQQQWVQASPSEPGRPGASGSEGRVWARTRDDGTFALDASAGAYEVVVDAKGFRRAKVVVPAPVSGVRIELARGAVVEGVVREADGRALAGVRVWAMPTGGEASDRPQGQTGTTDASGRFRVVGLEAGRYAVVAERFPADGSEESIPMSIAHAAVDVAANRTATVELRFAPEAILSGAVLDDASAAVAGAEVEALAERSGSETDLNAVLDGLSRSRARTDGQGRFSLRGLRAGAHLVTAVRDGYEPLDEPVRAQAGETELRIVLRRGAHLRGRVTGEAGAPLGRFHLNGAPVEAVDGRFEIPIVMTGAISLELAADGYAAFERRVQVTRGVDLDLGDVALVRGRTVTGQVLDAQTGAPIAAARVVLAPNGRRRGSEGERGERVLSGSDGRFALAGVGDGARLRVEREGYAPATVALEAEQDALVVRLDRGGRIAMRVLSASGEPMRGLDVAIEAPEGDGGGFGTTDGDGRYERAGLPPGTYFVGALREANPGLVPRRVELEPREAVEVELRARASGATLVVSLTGPGADRPESIFVGLYSGDTPAMSTRRDLERFGPPMQSREHGATRAFQFLERGRYTVLVMQFRRDGEMGMLLRPVEVGAASRQDIELVIPAELPTLPP